MEIEQREYQTFIVEKVSSLTGQGYNVVIELDCGMGKRVIMYRLLKEIFPNKRVVIFLHSQSSLQETYKYLTEEYGDIRQIGYIRSGISAQQKKYIVDTNLIILTLPTVFNNLLTRFPELSKTIDVIIINEVDKIIRRVSSRDILIMPWRKLLQTLEGAKVIGLSGTLRDDHVILDINQYKLRQELKTLLKYLKSAKLISIEDFIDTDIQEYIQYTEIHLYPVNDEVTIDLIQKLTDLINETKDAIKTELIRQHPEDLKKINRDFYYFLPYADVDSELVERLNKLLMLRKYIYSMPVKTYKKYLARIDETRELIPFNLKLTGKEQAVLNLVTQYKKATILCSFLSTVHRLSLLLKEYGVEVFEVTGKDKNKGEIINAFKSTLKHSTLILSPVGERDLDITETDVLIVFDVVNSPKTVYQKIKRSRKGHVFLLYYTNTAEEHKVKRVVNEIIKRYPWSIIRNN
ncbi:MAG: DEAD/DEAH box helicase family protein [Candidatus Heimdallarchaeaceae archaeon]